MNNCYHYKYSNGLQFVSRASLTLLTVALTKKNVEIPKLIGVWKFKKFKNGKSKTK
jgi:hypothetical protein